MDRQLSQIFIYPVKSLGAYKSSSSIVERRGLANDRRFMIVEPNGVFLTQRDHPVLASIDACLIGGEVVLRSGPNNEVKLGHPEPGAQPTELRVRVWKSELTAVSMKQDADDWISEFLGREALVVYMPDSSARSVSSKFDSGGDIVSFADGYPLLLVNTESLRALNERLETAVPVERFRPNLVIEGFSAFSEDRWKRIRVGDSIFRVVKPCARCVVTTIDQQTGEKKVGEPLRTLAEFRKAENVFPQTFRDLDFGRNDILFGVNLIPESPGTRITIGDSVEVLETVDHSS